MWCRLPNAREGTDLPYAQCPLQVCAGDLSACVLFPYTLTEGPDPLQHTLPPQPKSQQQATPDRGGFEHHAVITFTAITHPFTP